VGTSLFYLSKILRPFLTSPLFLCLAMAVIAIVALPATTRRRRVVKTLGLLACALLAVLSLPLFEEVLARVWETPRGSIDTLSAEGPFDAIVVLGGSIAPRISTSEHIELGDSTERLVAAARLYRAGIATKVLFTGGSGDIADQKKKEAPLAMALLKLLGVPESALILESESRNTHENATLSKPLLEAAGAKRIVLVTSAWHMRRSAAIFRNAGYDMSPYAVDTVVEPFALPRAFVPDAGALAVSTRILTEIAGTTAYWMLGRL
jgi:uncharacterized SAM-binding protein YcdF (DUF218 family)